MGRDEIEGVVATVEQTDGGDEIELRGDSEEVVEPREIGEAIPTTMTMPACAAAVSRTSLPLDTVSDRSFDCELGDALDSIC